MSKRAVRLLVMLAVLIIAVGIYVAVVLVGSGSEDQTEAAEAVRLVSIDTTSVIGISWSYDGADISLTKNDSLWQWSEDESCPISTTAVETLINAFSSVSAAQAVANAQSYEEYGLDTPAYEYSVSLVNGHTVTVSLGDYSSYAGGYYGAVSGDPAVYIVGEDIVSSFSLGIMDILQLESAPDLTSATEITLSVAGDSLSLRYYADSSGMSYSDSYHWFIQDGGKSHPASTENVTAILDSLTGLNWLNCIAYNADAGQLADCGIGQEGSASVTVGYTDPAGVWSSFTLQLGDYVDGACYANIKGSSLLYTISGAAADQFILLDYDDVRATELCMVDFGSVTSFSVELDGQTVVLDYAGEESSTDGSSELVSVPVWQRGGEKLDAAAVTAFTDAVTTVQIAETISGESGRREMLRIILSLSDGQSINLALYTYSSSYCVAIRDGEIYLVSLSEAEQLVECARALLPVNE